MLDFTTAVIKHNEIMLKTLLDKATKKPNQEMEKKMTPICCRFVNDVIDKEMNKDSKRVVYNYE